MLLTEYGLGRYVCIYVPVSQIIYPIGQRVFVFFKNLFRLLLYCQELNLTLVCTQKHLLNE